MSGTILVGVGIGCVVIAIGLLIYSVVYRNTTGKRIRTELEKEY